MPILPTRNFKETDWSKYQLAGVLLEELEMEDHSLKGMTSNNQRKLKFEKKNSSDPKKFYNLGVFYSMSSFVYTDLFDKPAVKKPNDYFFYIQNTRIIKREISL